MIKLAGILALCGALGACMATPKPPSAAEQVVVDASIQAYLQCIDRAVVRLDDGVSSPRVVGHKVATACTDEAYLSSADYAAVNGLSANAEQRFMKQAARDHVSRSIQAVIDKRSRRR